MAFERREPALVEDLGDETHVLDDRDRLAVADRDAGRLLAPVLEGVEAEVREVGDGLARRVHAEHPARVFGARQFCVQGHQYPMRVRRSSGSEPPLRIEPAGGSPSGCNVVDVPTLPVSCAAMELAGCCLWFTGLSGAGKSTIANIVVEQLRERGRKVELLDGDEVREHLSKGLGFSKADRDINIRRIGWVASVLARNGVVSVTAAISPYRELRDEVRGWTDNFVEIHVATSLEDCESRDVKGLYAKARAGEIPEFTGVSDPYEPPLSAEITLETAGHTPEESAAEVITWLEQHDLL
ncbi:MAG: adenylylsulfate kinase, partial [Actinomycetota bacterium]|nr:adenylylsulfate kinase [Actinomycetota bacterium]